MGCLISKAIINNKVTQQNTVTPIAIDPNKLGCGVEPADYKFD